MPQKLRLPKNKIVLVPRFFSFVLRCYPSFCTAVMVVMVWWLDFQLPMQSMPITTNVVSLNPAQAKCTRYNIM